MAWKLVCDNGSPQVRGDAQKHEEFEVSVCKMALRHQRQVGTDSHEPICPHEEIIFSCELPALSIPSEREEQYLAPSVPKVRKQGAKTSKWPENEGRHENDPQVSPMFSKLEPWDVHSSIPHLFFFV
jgi:hypothetical protein